MARVLVVEDDDTVAEVVSSYLRRAGHEVGVAGGVAAALAEQARFAPEVVVLDIMLPDGNGLELCAKLRAEGATAVILLSALATADDRVAGLENGADDYLTKPFSPRELVLRVAALVRHRGPDADGPVQLGPLEIDARGRRARVRGIELALTMREFDLLAYLVDHPGQVFSRAALLKDVWGWTFGDSSTVTVHVRRLREKIEIDPMRPTLIRTVWGVGYRLQLGEPQEPEAVAVTGAAAGEPA